MLFSLGFVVLFIIGGLTGLYLATLGTDIHLHDTYFVVAHFHFVMVGGMVMGYFAALHYWWPKMTGRMYSDWWSRVAASIIIVGFFLTFIPQFIIGYHGMPRRYPNYPDEFQFFNVMSTAGASILGLGYLIPSVYLTLSLFFGREGLGQPVERDRAGVADAQPADDLQLRLHAGGGVRAVRVRDRRRSDGPRPARTARPRRRRGPRGQGRPHRAAPAP